MINPATSISNHFPGCLWMKKPEIAEFKYGVSEDN